MALTDKQITAQEAMPAGWACPSEALKQSLSVHEVSHVFRNALSGGVLGTYYGSPLESVEAMAEAAGLNLRFYDIVERNRDETSWVRKCASSLLENAHPLSREHSARIAGFVYPTLPLYPPPGWRRFYKEFHGLIKRTALHKFVPHTQKVENDAAIKACAAVLQWQAFEIRMEYIKKELANGNTFRTFMLLEDGHPREPVKARDYEGCLKSICHHLSKSDEDAESLISAVIAEAEKYGIIEAVTEMVHEDGMHAYFA